VPASTASLLADQGRCQCSEVKPAPTRYPATKVGTTPVVEVERIHVHTHAHQGVNTIAFVRHVGTWASRSELMYRTNGIRVSVYLRRDFASLSVKWRRDNRPHQVLPARAMTEGEASVTARVGHMADSASGQREADPGGVSLASIGASSGAHAVVDHGARAVTAEDIDWLVAHLRVVVSASPAVWAGRGMTLLQLTALHFISALAPITVTDLAQALGTRPSATSAMVDRLTRIGLVCRMPDPQNRRRVRLTLTADAESIVGDIDLDTARRLQTVLAGMSPQTRGHLIDILIDTIRRFVE
jgi:MarR family transcriptional regulator, transcriptional regulator for hemolysin